MMRVHQQQDGVAHDRVSLFVGFPDEIASPPHPQAACVARIPGLLGHFLAGGLEPQPGMYAGRQRG